MLSSNINEGIKAVFILFYFFLVRKLSPHILCFISMYVLAISECEDSGPTNKKWVLVSSEQQQQQKKTVLNVFKKNKKNKQKHLRGRKSPVCLYVLFVLFCG